jgi:translation elongation factor EF-Tu-like GTPase
LTRCRIAHSILTHSYLLNKEERPECIPCNSNYSLKQIVHFVDIGGIVDHQCLNFLYIIHPTRKLSHGIKL